MFFTKLELNKINLNLLKLSKCLKSNTIDKKLINFFSRVRHIIFVSLIIMIIVLKSIKYNQQYLIRQNKVTCNIKYKNIKYNLVSIIFGNMDRCFHNVIY